MKIRYARVSTIDQNLALQLDSLNEVGCEKIFQEKVSAKNALNSRSYWINCVQEI